MADDNEHTTPHTHEGGHEHTHKSELDVDGDHPIKDLPDEASTGDKSEDDDAVYDMPDTTVQAVVSPSPKKGFFGKIKGFLGRHKIWTSVLGVVVVLAVLAAVPWTRYKVAGLFLKQTITVTVVDAQTQSPVTSAVVASGSVSAKTDNHGQARLHIAVGAASLSVQKTYYQSATLHTTVPIFKPKHDLHVQLTATGRQVPVAVVNKLNGQPIENAMLAAAGSEVKTDAKGQAVIVLPADKASVAATLKASGFNDVSLTIQVATADVAANHFQLTPSGQLYFLSNLSGKINVVKTNLDGSARQTVLAGTGKEDANNTVLLATRDWKYLALSSVRAAGNNPQLNLIDTTHNDRVVPIDSGNANFTPVGWSDDSFIYVVYRSGTPSWQSNAVSLKSYNATTGKLTTLDSTVASGTSNADAEYESLDARSVHILGNQVVYSKNWYAFPGYLTVAGKQNTLATIHPDGTGKKVISTLDASTGIYFGSVIAYEPQELQVEVASNSSSVYYEYTSDGSYRKAPDSEIPSTFPAPYPTYLLSPSGNMTFWAEPRDGKNTLFVGNANGDNGKQVAALSDYNVYGWYSDNYLLVSKNSSELYIMSLDGSKVLKVSDYYKPAQSFYGYGSGYGGL